MIAAGSNQIFLRLSSAAVQQHEFANSTSNTTINIHANIQTDFNPNVTSPKISKFVSVDPFAVLIGDYQIGKLVLVAPLYVGLMREHLFTLVTIPICRMLLFCIHLKQKPMAKILMTEDTRRRHSMLIDSEGLLSWVCESGVCISI